MKYCLSLCACVSVLWVCVCVHAQLLPPVSFLICLFLSNMWSVPRFKKLYCCRCAFHLRWKPQWAYRTAEPELNRSDVRRDIFERCILATSLPSTVIVSPRRGIMCQSDKISPVVGSLFRCVVWTVVRNHFQVGWCDVWQERCFNFPFLCRNLLSFHFLWVQGILNSLL